MGAEYQEMTAKGTKEAMIAQFHARVEEDIYEYGHHGYTGSFAEKDDISVHDAVMSEKEAKEHCLDNSEKWGSALAIPTNEERTTWYIGAWCSSTGF